MVNSMTGFGRSLLSRDGREITVELKSVNHRYLDVSFRMPRHIGFVEDSLRNILSQELKRGHVDVYLFYRNTREDARQVSVDQTLLGAYLEVARGVAERFQLRDDSGITAAGCDGRHCSGGGSGSGMQPGGGGMPLCMPGIESYAGGRG